MARQMQTKKSIRAAIKALQISNDFNKHSPSNLSNEKSLEIQLA